jgi:hypothetical protein
MNIPSNLPILSNGKQDPGTNKVCAEQAINWLVSGRSDLGDETDHPECVQPVLNALAIKVNDLLPDDRRGEMWPLILRQPGTSHPEMEPALSVRLACFLAEKVLDKVRPGDRKVCRDAITAAQVWCDNPNQEAAYAANATAYAANAAAAAAYAATADGPDALIQLLSDTQNECERLTEHVPVSCDIERLERLGELVGLRVGQ